MTGLIKPKQYIEPNRQRKRLNLDSDGTRKRGWKRTKNNIRKSEHRRREIVDEAGTKKKQRNVDEKETKQ